MYLMQFATALFAIGSCLVGACIDYKKGIIPNYVTFPAIFVGLICAFVSSSWHGVLVSLASAFVTALIPLFLLRLNAMGGGDVKLFAAMGALLGVDSALQILMMSFILGAGIGVVAWAREGVLTKKAGYAIRKMFPWKWRKQNRAFVALEPTYIRFGPAIFFASVFVLTLTQLEQGGYAVL